MRNIRINFIHYQQVNITARKQIKTVGLEIYLTYKYRRRLLMSSLWDQITVLHKKISKQDVIDTIKNGESSLLSLDINSDLKNEIREKVTNNIMHNFNKDRGMSAGSDPFLTVDHNFR